METNSPQSSEGLSVDGILDILNDEGEATPQDGKETKSEDLLEGKANEKESKEDESEEDGSEEELELSEEEPTDEDLNEEPISIPHRKEILKAFPDLFKKFPQLEKAYYREQKYAEILPTIEDAREAKETADTFSRFEADLFGGSPESVLRSVKDADPDSFGRIVDNLLPSLQKVDSQAYFHVIGNIIKASVAEVFKEGSRLERDDVKNAAVILNQVLLGNSQFTPPAAFGKAQQANPEGDKLQSERQAFRQEQFNAASDELGTSVRNSIISTIDKYIDPKSQMSGYVKKNAIREAFDHVDNLLQQDTRFRQVMTRLWEQAGEANYSRTAKDRIRSTYLSKAKTVLRDAINKARQEALKDSGNKRESNERPRLGRLPVGKAASPNSGKKEPPKGISVKDYIMADD